MTQSDQPIIRQNGLSSASSRASVAVTPMSRQIWWTQVVDGQPQVRLHSCERPLTVPRLGADSQDQVCRYIASKSGDMTKETQFSFTDDVWDVEHVYFFRILKVGLGRCPKRLPALLWKRNRILETDLVPRLLSSVSKKQTNLIDFKDFNCRHLNYLYFYFLIKVHRLARLCYSHIPTNQHNTQC